MSEWKRMRLDELCSMRKEQVQPDRLRDEHYVALEHIDSGRTSILRWTSTDGIRSNKCRFRKGDILYGKLRPYLDKAAITSFDGVCSTELLALDPNSAVVKSEFLAYLLHTSDFLSHAEATTAGVNHPRTSWQAIAEYESLIPSLSEQSSIASALKVVEKAIQVEERLVETLSRLKPATMAKVFREGLRGESLKKLDFGESPESWRVAMLSDVGEVQTGVAKGRQFDDADVVEVPYLRVANVQDGHLDLSEMKTIEIRRGELERYTLRDGDVVLTEGGDFDKLGRGFIWRSELPLCIHQNHVFAVRTDRAVLQPEFFAYLAQSPYGKAYFLQVAHKTTNLACINSNKLKDFPVVLPSLEEQAQVVGILDAIDQKLQVHQRKRVALDNLLKALLQQLMSGAIRVDDLDQAEVSHA